MVRHAAVAAMLFACFVSVQPALAQGIVEQRIGDAQRTGRPLLVIGTTETCPHCVRLMKQLQGRELFDYTSRYIPLEVKAGTPEFQQWAKLFPPTGNGVPMIWIVTAQGKELYNKSGAPAGDGVARLLHQGLIAASRQAPAAQAGVREGGRPVEGAAPAVEGRENPFAAKPGEMAGNPFAAGREGAEGGPQVERPVEESSPEESVAKEEPVRRPLPPTKLSPGQERRRLDSFLRIARQFADSRPEKAREYAQKIIDHDPESAQAAAAGQLLKQLAE